MIVSEFVEKYNKSEVAIPVEEKHVMNESGVYEAELEHDNIDEETLEVYSGANLTGSRIAYTLTAPSDASWKRIIHIDTSQPTIYISYETTGDQVEADDVNRLQDAVVSTQNAVNVLSEQVTGGGSAFTWNKLMGVNTGDTGLVITHNPSSVSVTAGDNATFAVNATSTEGDVTYRWQYEAAGSSIWQDMANGAGKSITLSSVTTEDNGKRFRCIVVDTAGNSQTSDVATLYVSS